jgi:hypothetical protein
MLLATATLFQKLSQAPIRRVRHRIPCCRGYEWWYSVGTSVPESPHTGIQPQGTALNHRPLRGGLMNQENLPFPTRSPAGPAVRDRNYAQRQQPNRLPEDGPCPLIAVADGAVPPSLSCGVRIDTLQRIHYEGMAATGSPDGNVPSHPCVASHRPGRVSRISPTTRALYKSTGA